jgi:proteasome lid subunit RPN8/RPN11/DNA-directed RNA polymerase subunit RPC12/RpoP
MLLTPVDDITEQRQPTHPGANSKTWRIPQCPFLIECSPAVLDQIRLEVERGRNLPGGERETGGVLFGLHDPNRIRILACKPLPCEHAMGAGFVLSEKDEQRLAHLISAPATDPELNGLEPLGWYHSHIRSKILLSERDRQIHSRYFAAPHQIALVIHPRSDAPARAGFFFQEPSGEMRTESSYEEFTIETPPPAAPELKPPVVSRPAPSHQRTSSASKPEPQQREAICPSCGSKRLRRSRRTGPIERFCGFFGFYPYRCHECLSRSFLKTSPDLLERARSSRRKRPEERRRSRQRTRREILLWGGGTLGFLAILYYLIRDTGPKPDQ